MDNGLSDEIRRKIEALRLGLGVGLGSKRGAGTGAKAGAGAGPGTGAGSGEDAGEDVGGVADKATQESDARDGIDRIPNAREVVSDHGKCLAIERPIEAYQGMEALDGGRIFEAYRALASRIGEARADCPENGLAFLDLETTGLSATPLFLAGTLLVSEDGVRSLQLLARDYSEERCLIALLDRALKDHEVCITFNGKSFDLPYLRERAKYHKLNLQASPRQIDLLHHARRQWRRRLPNCRLLTLEWYILGRRRIGDVDGWEVPCIYHDFVHTRDARKLKHVLRHNLMDVFSMAQLLISLAEA